MNEMKQHVHSQLGTEFRDTRGEQHRPPTFGPAAKKFRAIDLSCRACDACGAGAGCWAWIPGGGPHASVFTPNLRQNNRIEPIDMEYNASQHATVHYNKT